MKEPKSNPLSDQAVQAYRDDVVNYVARLTAGRMKKRMSELDVPVEVSLESIIERITDASYDITLLSLSNDSPLPAGMWVDAVFDGIKAYNSSDDFTKAAAALYERPNASVKGSELMLFFGRCAERVGKQVSDLLSDLLAERALTKADPTGYIAHVTALAAKKVTQQPNN